MRKLLPIVVAIVLALAVVLLIPSSDERPKLTNLGKSPPAPPPRPSPSVAPLHPVSSASSSPVTSSSNGSSTSTSTSTSTGSGTASLGTLEAQIVQETAQLARDLELDPKTEERIREITQRTFLELVAEINALREQLELAPGQEEKLVDAKQELLHDRILAILDKNKAARYRELIGREK